jgi:tellurite resistance-related uncharacterized protein
MPIQPYRATPVFTEATLPAGLRAEHRLKAGAWGLKLTYVDPPSEVILTPAALGRILPEQAHFVEPLGAMKMRVDFYDAPPGD